VPYQHRLLDALVRVKLGTQILAQDLSLSFGRRVGFERQALTLAGYRRPLCAQRGKAAQRDVDYE
jgi:hypothetical protein